MIAFPECEVNEHGLNKKIACHILSPERMKELGFSDRCFDRWYYCRKIRFPAEKLFKGLNITFNLTIYKSGNTWDISVLDEDFGQPYDYQKMIDDVEYPSQIALTVFVQVESIMEFMQKNGVISGHVRGEYI